MPIETLPSQLVDTQWLADNLDDTALRVYDCTVHLDPDPQQGYRLRSGVDDYEAGHIPGAGFLDLIEELSDNDTTLPLMMPPCAKFASAVGARGIGEGTSVILYSTTAPMWATRTWWMLKTCGFNDAAVLDGGMQKWRREGRPLSTATCTYPAAAFTGNAQHELLVDKEAVSTAIDAPDKLLVNALSPDIFNGDGQGSQKRPGRIPGSINLYYAELLDDEGVFLDQATLRTKLQEPLAARNVIAYCGGGISATVDAFALTMLGHEAVAVYDASMSEWASNPDLPMETGSGKGAAVRAFSSS